MAGAELRTAVGLRKPTSAAADKTAAAEQQPPADHTGDSVPSTLQQLPAEVAVQAAGDSIELAPINPAHTLNAVPTPDVSVLPMTSALGPIDERESLHQGILELASMRGAPSPERGTGRNATSEQDAVRRLKGQVSFNV